jgi:hypothetical protein
MINRKFVGLYLPSSFIRTKSNHSVLIEADEQLLMVQSVRVTILLSTSLSEASASQDFALTASHILTGVIDGAFKVSGFKLSEYACKKVEQLCTSPDMDLHMF